MLTAAKKIFIIMPDNAIGISFNHFTSELISEMNNENITNEEEDTDSNSDLFRINDIINFHSLNNDNVWSAISISRLR